MKISILYHPGGEFVRLVEEYARDFERQKAVAIELISLDTRPGAELGVVYDIVQYPALLVRSDNGELLKHWQGMPLPLMDELAGYLT